MNSVTDDILKGLNYLNDSKRTGNDVEEIVVGIVSQEAELFSKQVSKGKVSEEEISSFEAQIPGDWAYKGMGAVRKRAEEANTVAAMMRDAREASMTQSNGRHI